MTDIGSVINISGDLQELTCTKEDILELILLLIKVEPSLKKNLAKKSVNLSFISTSEIEKLNLRFLNKNKPTNVLSFPALESDLGDRSLGDIAICPEIIINEALDQGKAAQSHLSHIILHSLLHLAGHDHGDNDSADLMESLEVSVLEKLGIADPY